MTEDYKTGKGFFALDHSYLNVRQFIGLAKPVRAFLEGARPGSSKNLKMRIQFKNKQLNKNFKAGWFSVNRGDMFMDKWVDVFPLNADLFGKMASITVSDDVNANTI